MKVAERKHAISLRNKGYSLGEISKTIGVSKASVSVWVRDVKISSEKIKNLKKKGNSRELVEKRRTSRIRNEEQKRSEKIALAKNEIGEISNKELLQIGAMLYFAEGGKTQRGLVRFSNSDPRMIRIMMKFFRNICDVNEEKFKGHIHVHNHSQIKESEVYWQNITGISNKKFFKTYCRNKDPLVDEEPKSNKLKYGTFDIYVCDTNLFLRIQGWTEGIYERVKNK